MTTKQVTEYLRSKTPKFSSVQINRVASLIEQVGGCDVFVKCSKGQLEKAYNDLHPESPKGMGGGSFEAIDAAKLYISGKADRCRVEAVVAAEEQAKKDAEKEALLRGFDSEPFETAILEKAVSLAQVAGVKMLTIGRLKFLCQMVREGDAR